MWFSAAVPTSWVKGMVTVEGLIELGMMTFVVEEAPPGW